MTGLSTQSISSTTPTFLDHSEITSESNLAARGLAGEVIVIRGGMQHAGVFDEIIQATKAGVADAAGAESAAAVEAAGIERIHEYVNPASIPAVTDAAYARLTPLAAQFMDRLAASLFPEREHWYFEREPNVRFHIPYDIAMGFRKAFDKFAEKRGHGKVAAHGPHRDYWLDCPDNALNLWAALGPVVPGNGLTVYAGHFNDELPYNERGEVPRGVRLTKAMTFDLAPGDIVLFHSRHLHGSEVNRTDSTRVALSFRVTFGKPTFPLGHYHDYLHAGWQRGALRSLSHFPARIQLSHLRSLAERVQKRLFSSKVARSEKGQIDPGQNPIPLDSVPVGQLRAVSRNVAVARFGENDVAAVSRFCPHAGADLVDGHVEGSAIVCPWHNLEFDRSSGACGCEALAPLKRFPVTVRDGMIHVDLPADEREA